VDWLTDWVDPGAIRTLVESVHDAFDAAPVWARTGLLVMLAFAVVVGILRVASSLACRLVAVVVTATVVVLVFWAPETQEFVSEWWP